jgi:hypothetical protein
MEFIKENKDTFKAIGVTAGAVTAVLKLFPKLSKWWAKHRERRLLTKRLGAEIYTPEEILSATEHYIEPDCQDIDPSGGEGFRLLHPVREAIFKKLDYLLSGQPENRHTLILADSGMGKTSLILNYYARYARKRPGAYRVAVVPLGHNKSDEFTRDVKDKGNTVIFLDAFDEDTRAIRNHHERLSELLKATEEFRHVLITCRTQFFLSDEEIPRETGVVRVGVTRAGESKVYLFNKLYLAPFTNDQIRAYLGRLFPFWKQKQRRAAQTLCDRMSDLTARPMLLAHVPDLIDTGQDYRYSIDLYEEMVQAWIKREQFFVPDREKLLAFSEEVAINIYANRESRSAEVIPLNEVQRLAEAHNIGLANWQLTGRSLLNRTADGRRKFAHRSIMEYLIIRRFLLGKDTFPKVPWTDQMARFFWEWILVADEGHRNLTYHVDLERVDFDALKSLSLPRTKTSYKTVSDLNTALLGQVMMNSSAAIFRRVTCKLSDPDSLAFAEIVLVAEDVFRSALERRDDFEIYEDYKARLVWCPFVRDSPISQIDVLYVIQYFNASKIGGYHWWCLPTAEEILSTEGFIGELVVRDQPYWVCEKSSTSLRDLTKKGTMFLNVVAYPSAQSLPGSSMSIFRNSVGKDAALLFVCSMDATPQANTL